MTMAATDRAVHFRVKMDVNLHNSCLASWLCALRGYEDGSMGCGAPKVQRVRAWRPRYAHGSEVRGGSGEPSSPFGV